MPCSASCFGVFSSVVDVDQGFFYRQFGPNHRPPVPVNRTGLTGYRKKLAKFKFQTKNGSSTGFHRLADR
jgi:hypothetical protein